MVVIGGGVAGLETARVCAERGHRVTLCEKTGQLGGNLIPGGVPHFKRYDHKLIAYYKRQMELLGVTVLYQTTITSENISEYQAVWLAAKQQSGLFRWGNRFMCLK